MISTFRVVNRRPRVRTVACWRLAAALLLVVCATNGRAAGWPAWRGPAGNGICREEALPLRWSPKENIRWRVPLPGPGNSTPIVWGNRVFITQAIEKDNRRAVICFDRRDGKLLWQSGPTWTERDATHPSNPHCSSSPVTDGRRVVAWFGSAGVYCFDFRGRELWRKDLGQQSHQWGYASSPILYRNLCILNFGPGKRSFLVALDKRTGRTVWERALPSLEADAKWEDFGGDAKQAKEVGARQVSDIAGSFATPLIVRVPGGDEVVLAYPLRLLAFAPATGEPLWTCDGLNIGAYSSPFSGDGLVAVAADGFTNTLMAVRPGGRGDVSLTHRLWCKFPAESKACIGSGVIGQGRLYQVTYMGFAQCFEARTGQSLWEERLTGTGARNSSWSSPVLAEDRLYVPNQNGDVFVLRASPKFECLATNSIGSEPMNASPAISGGSIYLRTDRHLWCIANGKDR